MNEKNVYGMLSDVDIRKHFGNGIEIFTEYKGNELEFDLNKQLQLASIDLRFRNEHKRLKKSMDGSINYEMLVNHEYTDTYEICNNEKLKIEPGEIIFSTTLETVKISNDFAGIITGRSSIARLGVMVHCCQAFINPGQCAPIALQIINLGKYPVELDLKFPICQLILFKLSSPSSKSYSKMKSSKYKDELGPMQSKIYQDSEIKEEPVLHEFINEKNIKFKALKKFLKKYISPLLPSIIMLLVITPALSNIEGMTLSYVFSSIKELPFTWILVAVVLGVYIYLRKDE